MRSTCVPSNPSRLALLVLGGFVLLAAGAKPPEQQALDALQERYDAVRDLRARFVQTSTTAAFGESVVSRGSVVIERPGRMRWSYDPPDGRVIVMDGETLRLYSPGERQLQIAPLEESEVSPTALAILMGGARLREQFEVRLASGLPVGSDRSLGLELVPRGDRSFESLVLWIDPRDHLLHESVLVDLLGNRTRLELSDVQHNTGVAPDAFRLELADLPRGTDVIDIRKQTR